MPAHAGLEPTRRAMLKAGALTVSFALAGFPVRAQSAPPTPRLLDPNALDSFLAVDGDGSVTVFCGKVDLGQGLRIAMRQIVGEELGIGVDKIKYVEGDTALTPDQGRTSGSNGIQRGGMQLRRAAATARAALVGLAAQRLNISAGDLVAAAGEVRPKNGGTGIGFAELIGARTFNLKLDPKAPLKDPATYTLVGKPLPRPDVPAKCTGSFTYMQDFSLPDMVHARVIRPPAIGAKLTAVDETSIKDLPGAKVVRIKDFLAVTADDEWTAVRAARALRAQWSAWAGLPEQDKLAATLRADREATEEMLVSRGEGAAGNPPGAITRSATYFWPMQSHASIGPSCAVADVTENSATIWTASQGTHGNRKTFARFLRLPEEAVRLIYLDGAGCYGMNGHEDAAADAAILSRAVGRPVRVQWSRQDEHGWDPKGPPIVLDYRARIGQSGEIAAWESDVFLPVRAIQRSGVTLLAAVLAGLPKYGPSAGMTNPGLGIPYALANNKLTAHWLVDTPLPAAWIRAPGRMHNTFGNESFLDEIAAATGMDPFDIRLRHLDDQRGRELLERLRRFAKWEPRGSRTRESGTVVQGRGVSYVKYELVRTYVGAVADVTIDRTTGHIKVDRVWVVHDCGQIINPDGLRNQIEGNVVQTVSRTLIEKLTFSRSAVTSLNWGSYPILTFPNVPQVAIDLIDRPAEVPWGAGEPTTAVVPAAIANAVFDATGARLRSVPFRPAAVLAALGSSNAR
jgi:nicotinate dehydrogenase subunit B